MHTSEKDKCVCDSCRSRAVLYARIDSLIDILKPNEESERVRDGTVKWVRRHFEDAPIQSVGSYPLKTYLPSSDIDLLVVENRKNWYSRICSSILKESSKKMSKIRSLEFVNGNSMGVVRFVLNNVTVDITCFSDSMGNPMKSIIMLEKFANKTGQDDLFKRSVILIKAWLRYETDSFGARRGGLCKFFLCLTSQCSRNNKSTIKQQVHTLSILWLFMFSKRSESTASILLTFWRISCRTTRPSLGIDSVFLHFRVHPRLKSQSNPERGVPLIYWIP